MTHVLVTGGTGTLGRAVVRRLLDSGHRVRVASRHERPPTDERPYGWCAVDYRTGSGLADATAGVDAVVHCASSRTGAGVERQLVDAARAAGLRHLVHVSIVGIDRVPYGYYRVKLDGERVVRESGLPWTTLRATQFHDLVRTIVAGLARLPVLPVPDVPVQPVDVDSVAARLAELAVGAPAGRVEDLGGPEVRRAPDLARSFLRATGRRRVVVPIRLPGNVFRLVRDGALLTPDHQEATVTFEDYLQEEMA